MHKYLKKSDIGIATVGVIDNKMKHKYIVQFWNSYFERQIQYCGNVSGMIQAKKMLIPISRKSVT